MLQRPTQAMLSAESLQLGVQQLQQAAKEILLHGPHHRMCYSSLRDHH
jgi:hypothetical protein